MIKTFAYGLLYTLVIGLFSACNSDCHDKGNCAPEYYKYDLGEAKNYLWADTGSYWIYKNSKTGELDTQTCVGAITYWVHTQGTTNYAKHVTIDYEVLSRRIFSTFNQWEYNDKTTGANPNVAVLENNIIIDRTVGGEGINCPFFYPPKINYKLDCIRPNTKYYWVKNIGLIKKTMNRCNYSWDLIDYKIKP